MHHDVLVASQEGNSGSLLVIRIAEHGATFRSQVTLRGPPQSIASHPTLPLAYVACWGVPEEIVAVQFRSEGDSDVAMTILDTHPADGALACSLAIHPAGTRLVIAYYEGGLASVRLAPDGRFGETAAITALPGPMPVVSERQDVSHPHFVAFISAPTSQLIAVDFGADRVHRLDLDPETGAMSSIVSASGRAPSGSGPRHAAVLPDGRAVVTDELSSTLSSYDGGVHGFRFTGSVPSTRRNAGSPNYPSDVVATPDGLIAFTANRGSDTVTVFSIDGIEPAFVEEVPSGAWPMKLLFQGDVLTCASRDEDALVSWRFDRATTSLSETGRLHVPGPTWVSELPAALELHPQDRSTGE